MEAVTERKSEHFMVCGRPLEYRDHGTQVCCSECGRSENSAIVCPGGHYVCNPCHSEKALANLLELAMTTTEVAPEDILEELLTLPNLPMHGPEHHAMAGLAMLVACDKAGVELPENYLEEAIRRSMQIPGGTCGYHGACGGAVSLGVAVSIITPLTGLARGLAHRATALALRNCGDDEARCCKRAVRKTVSIGREFFAGELGIELPRRTSDQFCTDIARNRECVKGHCPYFNRTNKSSVQ